MANKTGSIDTNDLISSLQSPISLCRVVINGKDKHSTACTDKVRGKENLVDYGLLFSAHKISLPASQRMCTRVCVFGLSVAIICTKIARS